VTEKPGKILPALYGGVITGATIGLPFLNLLNCFCCGGVLLGGLLSVFFYTRDLMPGMPSFESGEALQLGALSGVFGAVVGTFLQMVVLLSIGDFGREFLSSIVYDGGIIDNLPPEIADALEEELGAPESFSFFGTLASLFVWLIIGPLFGLLGGLIGHVIFKPKSQLQGGPPAAPPVPPSTSTTGQQ